MKVTGMFLFLKGKYERSLFESKVLGYSRMGKKMAKEKTWINKLQKVSGKFIFLSQIIVTIINVSKKGNEMY